MASVHHDPRYPRGVWYCSYTLADGRRAMRSTGSRTKAQAKIICEAWAETERAASQGSLSTSRAAQVINETLIRLGHEQVARVRLGEWLDEWLASKTGLSSQIQKRYAFARDQLLKFLGTGSERRFLDSVGQQDIAHFLTHLASEGRCGATLKRIRNDLGGAFNRAARLGVIAFNPFHALEPQKDDGMLSGRKTFSREQIAKLIETSRGTDWEGAIRFAYTSGARLGDVSNLRWDAIDLANGVIVFRQRKLSHRNPGRETIVAIHPDFENWLLRQPGLDEPQRFVFPALANRSAGGNAGLSNEFNALVALSGIDAGLIRARHGTQGRSRRNLSFHSLRHGAVSAVFNSAALREVARRITDHAERGSLDRYLHVDIEALKAATALIPRLPL